MTQPTFPLRPIDDDEWTALGELQALAFHRRFRLEAFDVFRGTLEGDRTLVAFDGAAMVASSAVHTMSLTVPGAVVPAAGLTVCTVHPAYRGRGLLSAMMKMQLTGFAEAGEAVSILWAKEASLYQRYGYGVACKRVAVDIGQHEAALVPGAPDTSHLGIELAAPGDARQEMMRVYDELRPTLPGYIARTEASWTDWLYDPRSTPESSTRKQTLLVHDDAAVRGYALYDVAPSDDGLVSTGHVRLHELLTQDPATYVATWRYLASLALTNRITAQNMPVDAPLLGLLADPRRARVRHSDGLWARLVRVDEALTRRRYAAPVDVVIQVVDDRCPWNTGSWRLSGDETGASCERTTDAVDIRLDVTALASAYLGDSSFAIQSMTGQVDERRTGSLRRLSAAMSWEPKPWCPHKF